MDPGGRQPLATVSARAGRALPPPRRLLAAALALAVALVLAGAFDVMSDAGKDEWLLKAKAIPPPVADDGSQGDPTRSAAIRLSWLDDEGIRGYYFANPNPGEIAEWPP